VLSVDFDRKMPAPTAQPRLALDQIPERGDPSGRCG
jgi:hypothetical protein